MQPNAVTEGRALAWAAAALAAGPIFVLLVMAVPVVRANQTMPWSLLLILPLAIALGLVIAAVPIGCLILLGGRLGARWPVFRHPLLWACVGAAAGVALGAVADVTRLATASQSALAGAAVAGIARRFVRWPDPAVTPESAG